MSFNLTMTPAFSIVERNLILLPRKSMGRALSLQGCQDMLEYKIMSLNAHHNVRVEWDFKTLSCASSFWNSNSLPAPICKVSEELDVNHKHNCILLAKCITVFSCLNFVEICAQRPHLRTIWRQSYACPHNHILVVQMSQQMCS